MKVSRNGRGWLIDIEGEEGLSATFKVGHDFIPKLVSAKARGRMGSPSPLSPPVLEYRKTPDPVPQKDLEGRAMYVVSLERREDRWNLFKAQHCFCPKKGWEFPIPMRYPAIDGQKLSDADVPSWFKAGKNAWGCYQSHLRILKMARKKDLDEVWIFEDDAIFCENFEGLAKEFLARVPGDADWIYLGGQHLNVHKNPPEAVNRDVLRPFNLNRTHAYIVRRKAYDRLIEYLEDYDHFRELQPEKAGESFHLDHYYGKLHETGELNVYCPTGWLVGQGVVKSDINGRTRKRALSWNKFPVRGNARRIDPGFSGEAAIPPSDQHPVIVLGAHRSGSSITAASLLRLGGERGGSMMGFEHGRAGPSEIAGLARICEEVSPIGGEPDGVRAIEAARRVAKKAREICERHPGKSVVLKYPTLALFWAELDQVFPRATWVFCRRPFEHTVESLVARGDVEVSREVIETTQSKIIRMMDAAWDSIPANRRFECEYARLLADPRRIMEELSDFCSLGASDKQIEDAVSWVNPKLNHARTAG